MISESTIAIISSVALFVTGWVFKVWYENRQKVSADSTAATARHSERLDAVEKQLAQMDFKITPMWAKVQRQISEDLHQPHPRFKEMDGLLEKLDNETIDNYPGDRTKLKKLLLERSVDMDPEITDSQRASAAIMATVMDKVVAENKIEGELINVEATGESPKVEG